MIPAETCAVWCWNATEMSVLQRGGWDGWVAVEPFDYVPDGPGCAAWSAGYLKGLLQTLDDRT